MNHCRSVIPIPQSSVSHKYLNKFVANYGDKMYSDLTLSYSWSSSHLLYKWDTFHCINIDVFDCKVLPQALRYYLIYDIYSVLPF